MAKRKPSKRFVVPIGGELKRLFSVREGGSGRLLVTTHNAGMIDRDGNGELAAITEYRHTIHPSEQSDATTIHHMAKFETGERRDLHILTNAIRDCRLQPVQVRSVYDLRWQPPLVKHAQDEVLDFPAYDPTRCTLHYALWIGPVPEIGFPQIFYSLAVARFKRFMLYVPFCYSPQPSPTRGRTKEYSTSSEEKLPADARAMGHRSGIAEGCLPEECATVVVSDFNEVIRIETGELGMHPMPPGRLRRERPLFVGQPIT